MMALLTAVVGWLRWLFGFHVYVTSLAMMDIYLSGYSLYDAWLVILSMLPDSLFCPCWLGLLGMLSRLTSDNC
jgi:uncharacterized membrane protein